MQDLPEEKKFKSDAREEGDSLKRKRRKEKADSEREDISGWRSRQRHTKGTSSEEVRRERPRRWGVGEEEKLKFYITSFSFSLCNSACPLQSLDQ